MSTSMKVYDANLIKSTSRSLDSVPGRYETGRSALPRFEGEGNWIIVKSNFSNRAENFCHGFYWRVILFVSYPGYGRGRGRKKNVFANWKRKEREARCYTTQPRGVITCAHKFVKNPRVLRNTELLRVTVTVTTHRPGGKFRQIGTILVPEGRETGAGDVITIPRSRNSPKIRPNPARAKTRSPEFRFADKSSSVDIILAELCNIGPEGARKTCNFLSLDDTRTRRDVHLSVPTSISKSEPR